MEQAANRDCRDSWGGWISNKVASAEAALTTALVGEEPMRSRSFHNLRDVAKTTHLAKHHHRCQHDDNDPEVLPPLTRRASGLDVTLSHAWGVVTRAAVAAMATFDQPPQSADHAHSNLSNGRVHRGDREQFSHLTRSQSGESGQIVATLREMTVNRPCASDTPPSENLLQKDEAHDKKIDSADQKTSWDAQTEISDVTLSISSSCADSSYDKETCATFADPPKRSSSKQLEDIRASTTSSNQDKEKHQHVLGEVHECASNVEEHGEYSLKYEPESASKVPEEEVRKLLDSFNVMFEQNGGADCVSRVKEIGDNSLATMRAPVDLNEAVEKELNDAKLKLNETLQRLDAAVRTKVNEVYAENADASAAAEAVIKETKENALCKNTRRRNAILLRDCSRLLAVFATKICASILERTESDKHVCTWSERVECIASVSSQGIPQLRVISERFAEAIGHRQKGRNRSDCSKDLAERISRLADAAVEHVVQCVALATAALQIEVVELAYQCSA